MHRTHAEQFVGARKKLLKMDPKTLKNIIFLEKIQKKLNKFDSRMDVAIRVLRVSAVLMILLFPLSNHTAKTDLCLALRRWLCSKWFLSFLGVRPKIKVDKESGQEKADMESGQEKRTRKTGRSFASLFAKSTGNFQKFSISTPKKFSTKKVKKYFLV